MGDARLALPDVNVLVALTNPSHVFHREAHRWLAEVEGFATTPVSESGLVRLLLNPAVTGQPVTGEQALAVLAGVRADPRAELLADDSSLAAAAVDTTGLAGHQRADEVGGVGGSRVLRPEVAGERLAVEVVLVAGVERREAGVTVAGIGQEEAAWRQVPLAVVPDPARGRAR